MSTSSVLATLFALWRRHGLRPYEAHRDGLSNPRLADLHRRGAIPKRELLALQRRLNPADLVGLVEDKAIFYAFCAGAGLPNAGLLAVLDDSLGWLPNGAALRSAEWVSFLEGLAGDLVIKPARGVYGLGVHIWSPTRGERAGGPAVQRASAEAVVESLRRERWGRYLVQKRLLNHPAIRELTGSDTLQTVRMQTLVTRSGEIVMAGCLIKLAAGEGVTDNFAGGTTGNLLASIELATGRLRPGMRARPGGIGIEPVLDFPRTGRRIVGFTLPHWNEARALVRRAAGAVLPLRTIGWDVALTAEGPVIVEANVWWDPPNVLCANPGEADHPAEMAGLLERLRAEALADQVAAVRPADRR